MADHPADMVDKEHNEAFLLCSSGGWILHAFRIMAIGVFGFIIFNGRGIGPMSLIASLVIAAASMWPLYMWCSGRVYGMPLFPAFAIVYLWTYAFPIACSNPKVMSYSSDAHMMAALCLTAYLASGTFLWARAVTVRRPVQPPHKCRCFSGERSENLLLIFFLISTLFFVANYAGWLSFSSTGVFSFFSNGFAVLSNMAVFVLSFEIGRRRVSKRRIVLFLVIFLFYLAARSSGLTLRVPAGALLLGLIAYVLGRRKLGVGDMAVILLPLLALCLLQFGKGEMRREYKMEKEGISPVAYVSWYSEWFRYGLEHFRARGFQNGEGIKESLPERESIIQMLLLAQSKTPKELPFLKGETYAVVPGMLVPRVINPSKALSHEATTILSIYYGLQDREATTKTTIAWGFLAEAYANFGFWGCMFIGAFFGWFYGKITRFSSATPVMSARFIFSGIALFLAINAEWTASVYFAALYQASVTMLALSFLFMKVSPVTIPEGAAMRAKGNHA